MVKRVTGKTYFIKTEQQVREVFRSLAIEYREAAKVNKANGNFEEAEFLKDAADSCKAMAGDNEIDGLA